MERMDLEMKGYMSVTDMVVMAACHEFYTNDSFIMGSSKVFYGVLFHFVVVLELILVRKAITSSI